MNAILLELEQPKRLQEIELRLKTQLDVAAERIQQMRREGQDRRAQVWETHWVLTHREYVQVSNTIRDLQKLAVVLAEVLS